MRIIKFSFYFLGLFLLSLPLWVDRYFGTATFDQLLFTVQFGLGSTVTADPIFIKRFIKWCVIAPFILSFIFLYLERKTFLAKIPLCFIVFFMGTLYFSQQFSVWNFLHKNISVNNKTDYFKLQYVNPAQISFRKLQPKNLVLIYVEGLEANYANEKIFHKNLLQRLDRFKKNGVSFNQFTQSFGTGWTVAGLVASQCGIPLKSVTVFGDNRQGEVIDQFLAGATCLSDILAKQGYENIYMKGASLRFGGIKQFLLTHHYAEIYGMEEWVKLGKFSDTNGWGLHDDALFVQAKLRLDRLMASGKLFNLTLLTVDTHGYEGYLNQSCQRQGYSGFEGIVECTAHELQDFISYLQQRGWLEKISVVIIGDHLAMKNPVYDQLEKHTPRTIFNLILSSESLVKRTNAINHFDLLPSILDALGITYSGTRLGLGYSGFKRRGEDFAAGDRDSMPSSHLEAYSAAYNALWVG